MKKRILSLLMIITISGVSTGCGNTNKEVSNTKSNTELSKDLSLLTMDINPSIELLITEDNKISSANAVNDDAKEILKGLDLVNDDLKEGISELIDASVSQGYITNLEDGDILITIDGASTNQTLKIKDTTLKAINETLEEKKVYANIATQEIEVTDDLVNKAMKEKVSVGKLYAIDELKSMGYEGIGNYKDASIRDIVKIGEEEKIFDNDKDDKDDKDDVPTQKAPVVNDDNDKDDKDDKDDVPTQKAPVVNDDNDKDDRDDKDDKDDKDDVPTQKAPVVNDDNDKDDKDDKDDIPKSVPAQKAPVVNGDNDKDDKDDIPKSVPTQKAPVVNGDNDKDDKDDIPKSVPTQKAPVVNDDNDDNDGDDGDDD